MSRYSKYPSRSAGAHLDDLRDTLADLEAAEESFRGIPVEIGSPAAASYGFITETMDYFYDAIEQAEAAYR